MCKFDPNSPNWSWFLKSFIKLESLQTEIEKLLIFQRIPPTSNFLIRVFIFVKCRQWQYWQISFMQSQAHLDTNHSTFSSSLKIGQFKEKDCRRMKSLKYRGVLFVCFIKFLSTRVISPVVLSVRENGTNSWLLAQPWPWPLCDLGKPPLSLSFPIYTVGQGELVTDPQDPLQVYILR